MWCYCFNCGCENNEIRTWTCWRHHLRDLVAPYKLIIQCVNLYHRQLVMISDWNCWERNHNELLIYRCLCQSKKIQSTFAFWKRNFLSFTSHFVASIFNNNLIHVIIDLYLTFMIYWSCSKYVNLEYKLTASLNICSCIYSCRNFRFRLQIYRTFFIELKFTQFRMLPVNSTKRFKKLGSDVTQLRSKFHFQKVVKLSPTRFIVKL